MVQRQDVARKYGTKVYSFQDEYDSYDQLRKEYLKLADIADRRMRRLEEYQAKDKKYENILKFAYDKAIYDIQAETGFNTYRFKQGVPKEGNVLTIQSRINDVLKFLNSPTSTITGIKAVYSERAKKINEIYGLDLTWENMADFFENDLVTSMKQDFASKTAMQTLGKFYRNKDEILDMFQKKGYNPTKFVSEKTDTKMTAKQMKYLYDHQNELEQLTKLFK